MDAAGELAQLLECLGELGLRAREQLDRRFGIARDPRLDETQRDGERDEPLLRAVVQVPLERAPRRLLCADEPRARRAQIVVDALALGDVDAR